MATIEQALVTIRDPDTREILTRGATAPLGRSRAVRAMLRRADEFTSPLLALVAGIGVDPASRRDSDVGMRKVWERPLNPGSEPVPELVVGSGPHALIYATIRARKGVPVLIVEKNRNAGGSFACSQGPAFWLNSRNRPGPLALPGEQAGLNVLLGCLLQPSMISGGEYQTNDELAWAIRINLLLNPLITVHTEVEVTGIQARDGGGGRVYEVAVNGNTLGDYLYAKRVVIATGLGDPIPFNSDGDKPKRLATFTEFMSMMDLNFPLRGMNRVAVLGPGDSGKTTVETLLGQGPGIGMSVAGLDWPERIDWYGAPWTNQNDYCAANRGRYARIGKQIGGRVRSRPVARVYPASGFDCVQIGPRSYDSVFNCVGYTGTTPLDRDYERTPFYVGERLVARRLLLNDDDNDDEVYLIGPAADIPLTDADRQSVAALANIPDNASSLFRYAPLTATFADTLPVKVPVSRP